MMNRRATSPFPHPPTVSGLVLVVLSLQLVAWRVVVVVVCEEGPVGSFNIAAYKPSRQIDTYGIFDASMANDGNPDGNAGHLSCSSTISTSNTWWVVDLMMNSPVFGVRIKNRDTLPYQSLREFSVYVSMTNPLPLPTSDSGLFPGKLCHYQQTYVMPGELRYYPCSGLLYGRYVYLWKVGAGHLQLCEFEVLAPYLLREFTYNVSRRVKSQAVASTQSVVLERGTHIQCSVTCLNLSDNTGQVMQFDEETGECWCFENKPFTDNAAIMINTMADNGTDLVVQIV